MIRTTLKVGHLATILWVLTQSNFVYAQNPGGENLLGLRGILHSTSAENQPSGWISLGTDFQFFKAGDFLQPGIDHSRFANSFSVSFAPWDFLEAAFGIYVIGDSTTTNNDEELNVAIGDPRISLKSGWGIGHGFFLAGLFDLRFKSGVGFFEASGTAIDLLFAALATWNGGASFPLNIHFNLGFQIDGSKNLFTDLSSLSLGQIYSAQINSFNYMVVRFSLEYATKYIGPFVELSLHPFLGNEAPSFSESPGLLSLGVHAWPTESKSLQLMAAMDIGITGVGGDRDLQVAPNKYAVVIPRWNLVLGLAYRFDVFGKSQAAPSVADSSLCTTPKSSAFPAKGTVEGTVINAKTKAPIQTAKIHFDTLDVSDLSVNPNTGSFRSFSLNAGTQKILVSAAGYNPHEQSIEVPSGGTIQIPIELEPRTSILPGTIRGTIKTLSGQIIQNATILLPQIDQKIHSQADGTFSITLNPGEYTVLVSAKGYRTQRKTIQVNEGSTVILNVELHR